MASTRAHILVKAATQLKSRWVCRSDCQVVDVWRVYLAAFFSALALASIGTSTLEARCPRCSRPPSTRFSSLRLLLCHQALLEDLLRRLARPSGADLGRRRHGRGYGAGRYNCTVTVKLIDFVFLFFMLFDERPGG